MEIQAGIEIRDLEEHLVEATNSLEQLCLRREELAAETEQLEAAKREILEQLEEGEVRDDARAAEVRRELEEKLDTLREDKERTDHEIEEQRNVAEQVRDKCADQIKRHTEAADIATATPGGTDAVHLIWTSINDLQDLQKRANDALARAAR
jgi:chromosome segregation ATPase